MPLSDIACALLVVVLWGCNFLAIHAGLAEMPPLLFATVRFALMCLFLPFVKRPQVSWRDLALVGLFLSVGQFAFLYTAMATGLASGLVSLLVQSQAMFTVVVAAVVLQEKPRPIQLVGMGVALVGLAVVALGRSGATPLLGIVLCLGAAMSWACGNVASKRCVGASGLGLTVWSSVFVPLPLGLLSLALEGPGAWAAAPAHVTGAVVVSTAYTVVLSGLVGYTLWNMLLGRHATGVVAPFSLLVPVVGVLAGWVVLGERPNVASFVGGALLLAGVAVVVLGPRLLAPLRRH